MNDYLKPGEVCGQLQISRRTLYTWTHSGKIKSVKTKGGQYRYHKEDIFTIEKNTFKQNYCYCRVSTRGQLSDLERQVEFFQSKYPNHRIIRDIGPGLNFKRKGLKTILDEAIKGNIGEIVVTHKDRLCRFGFEIIEGLIEENPYYAGRIVVLHKDEATPERELTNELLSIITVFSAWLHGLRSHKLRNQIKTAIENGEEECGDTNENS